MKGITNILRTLIMLAIVPAFMTSCVHYTDQGEQGLDGRVYFGIDYDFTPIYSYWDNNFSVPENPYFGEFYRTEPGIYDFEYFINPYEYWWGTYSLYQNPGEWGGTYGQQGLNGADSFFLLICNQNGFYSETWDERRSRITMDADGFTTIETNGEQKFKLVMKKSHVRDRPARGTPKYKRD